MFSCRQFNNPGDLLVKAADTVEAVYWKEWPKAVSSRMTSAEKKDLLLLLTKAMRDPLSAYFRVAGACSPKDSD
jgi:transcription initiation factor TFIID subunit 2